MEFDGKYIEPERMKQAVDALARRHGMLRAGFLPDGRQYLRDDASWHGLTLLDLRKHVGEAVEERLSALRERLSHQQLDVENGEVFALHLTRLPTGVVRLHCRFDLLVADGRSIQIILGELARLYTDSAARLAPIDYDFPRYLQDCRTELAPARAKDEKYWTDRIGDMPLGPNLPLATAPETIECPRFRRHEQAIPARTWAMLGTHAKRHGMTRAMTVAAAYCEVLARWSTNPRFLLNVPYFGRVRVHPHVTRVVGDFSNLVPVVADLADSCSFAEQARNLQRTFEEGRKHNAYHGVEILRALRSHHRGEGNPAPVVFTYNVFDAFGDDLVPADFRQALGHPGYIVTQTPQVWIDHQVFQLDGEAQLVWDAVDGLFPPGMVEDMFDAEIELLERLAADQHAWRSQATPSLPARQRATRRLLNDTSASITPDSLHSSFFKRASRTPHHPALLWGRDQVMSYSDLAQRALRVAHGLCAAGVRPGDVVAVNAVKGPDQIVAALGVLAASAAYLPLGSSWPPARHTQVLGVGDVRFAVDTMPGTLTWPQAVKPLSLDTAIAGSALDAPLPCSPEQPAYVLFTSGSTGTPKGVEMSHQSALNTLAWVNRTCEVGAQDRVLALSALEFDLSVYDVFGLLSAGGSVVLPLEEQRQDARAWWDLLERHGVTIWNSVPILLESLLSAAPDQPLPNSLRTVLLSGDWIAPGLPARIRSRGGARRVLAMGGATEAGIWSTVHDAGDVAEDAAWIPYGSPLANQTLRVVDTQGRECPDWVPGELWIGGAGLAGGYLKDPVRTAERFVVHDGERWYRTGDLVRYRHDGELEILGRIDLQVKVNGLRIELGEIETALTSHASVAQAVTVAVPTHKPRDHRLVSYVVPAGDIIPLEAVHAHLAANLPRHCLPSRLIVLDELPLTSNGKVDRATLTSWAAETAAPPHSDMSPPQPGTEAQLAALWSELLDEPVRHRSDEFSLLGGNSILTTRLAALIHERLGVSLSVREVTSASQLRDLAALIDERAVVPTPAADRR
ncbi:amino acid adenylation domain-containing protein [Streptomyces sp. V4I8]